MIRSKSCNTLRLNTSLRLKCHGPGRLRQNYARKHLVNCSNYARFSIELRKPLGLILGSSDGFGAVVEEVTSEGNASLSGLVEVGDVISKVSAPEGLIDCEAKSFEAVISLLGSGGETVQLELRREAHEIDTDSNIAAYWERKRNEKIIGKQILRRTVGMSPKDIRIDALISQGNFGTVFSGFWNGIPVILKTSKPNVLWADNLLDVELEINEIVHRNAKGSCAIFLGCCEIDARGEGQIYNGTLPSGLWLMWKNEGLQTLASLFKCSDDQVMTTLRHELRMNNDDSKLSVIKKTTLEIASCLSQLHSVGIVHRDVKPENILLASGKIVFIDLGASASCLGAIINYYRGHGPADPLYCAPSENFLIPPTGPAPTLKNAVEVWEKFNPDRFDIFSIGVLFMQLCVLSLRNKDNLQLFIKQLQECNLDLFAWRKDKCKLPLSETIFLDADEEAGWKFASQLLRERAIRLSASQIISHGFLS